MRSRQRRSFRWRPVTVVAAAAAALSLTVTAGVAPADAAPSGPRVTSLNFSIPASAGGTCNIVGDLYTPRGASADAPVPALLATNGFGGSKDDLKPMATMFARRGYAVLAYSGLGFGGSSCRVSLDSPDPDGKAASRLIDYLGGASGIAFRDAAHRTAAPAVDFVIRDSRTANGTRAEHDPRVGMFGGSYGGHIQFATAAVDPRLDAIVPMATWNDLSYSIAPNNTGQRSGVTTATAGAVKLNWGLTFTAGGVIAGATKPQIDPGRLTGCPNFPAQVCEGMAQGLTSGVASPRVVDRLRSGSVTTFSDRVRVPTLLVQGQQDTLFNLNESIATYRALTARGVPTQMIWFSGGHSGDTKPGDLDEEHPDPTGQYVTGRLLDWADRYLKGSTDGPDHPGFAYFRDWVGYRGNAAPAYASAPSFDTGSTTRLRFSGADRLVADGSRAAAGRARLTTPPTSLPIGSDRPDGLGLAGLPERDVPGTFARWSTTPLSSATDVVGSPTVTLRVDAPGAARDQLVLFFRIVDVDAAGRSRTVGELVAPVRVHDPSRPFTVTMPAVVHRFEPGHSIALIASGQSRNYRGGAPNVRVSIPAGSGSLELPTTDL